MKWLALSLAGPGIWAAGFTLVYALHGTGCAQGWPEVAVPGPVTLHAVALSAGWLATLAAGAILLAVLPAAGPEDGLRRFLPRAGAWIGLGATAFTLLPVAVATSC